MRKRLAIVAIVIAAIPIYGQQESRQPAADKKHGGGAAGKPPSAIIQCKIEPNGTAIKCDYSQTDAQSYLGRLSSPENLPNLLLVFVGLLGIGAAIATLRAIKRQADTFVSKERARITVEIEPIEQSAGVRAETPYPSIDTPPGDEIWYAELLIANSGETNAFVERSFCKACIKATGWIPGREFITSQIGLPKVLHPHEEAFRHSARIETGNLLKFGMDKKTVQAIADGSMGIYVIGHIEFGDVFDNRWTVKFCRKWGAWSFGGMWQGTDIWYDYPDDILPEKSLVNGEFRIEKRSPLRRILRRMRSNKTDMPKIEIT